MIDDNLLPFCFPAVRRKKITAAFDGGRISSDGGVMLLAQADHRLGIAERLARAIPDGRDPDRVTHLRPDILRARIFAIACGYEDADDLDPAAIELCGRHLDTPQLEGRVEQVAQEICELRWPQSPSSTARKCWVKRRSYRRASAEGSAQREEAGAPSDACFGAGCPPEDLISRRLSSPCYGESAKNH